jgi:uncharacterized protein YecA (UPF0149 family)
LYIPDRSAAAANHLTHNTHRLLAKGSHDTGYRSSRCDNRPEAFLFTKSGEEPCQNSKNTTTLRPFEVISKRRKSFPSETRVKRGERYVHGDVELVEKLGRNDPCPCGSGLRFQAMLPEIR